MGDLILLADRIADRSRPARGPAAFFFVLSCPISYLAAERVERVLGEVEWFPVPALGEHAGAGRPRRHTSDEWWAAAEREAEALRLPLIPPENPLADPQPLSRAAVLADVYGVGSRFALAAARLIFCGGYDADDPQVIADAADVAGLPIDEALRAALDDRHDLVLEATTLGLSSRGVGTTPAIRVGARWFEGLMAITGASTYSATRSSRGAPSNSAG